MIDWKLIAISTPVLFVSFQSLVRLVPKGTSLLLVNAYAAATGAVIMLLLHLLTQTDKSLVLNGKSLALSLGIGALIGAGNFGVFKALSLGAPQSTFTPLFYIALILYGIIFGLVFFKEGFNLMQLVGTIVAIAGVVMIFYFKDKS